MAMTALLVAVAALAVLTQRKHRQTWTEIFGARHEIE
jgi:hypothetical protein